MFGDRHRRLQRRVGQRDDEFLAAIARRDVLVLDVLLHRQRHQAQHLVAGKVAEPVVEALEVVDVRHQQRQRLVLRRGFGDALGESGIEIFAVGERGERIGEAFGAHRLEIVLQLLDLLLRCFEPRLELLVARLHGLGARDEMLDNGAQRLAVQDPPSLAWASFSLARLRLLEYVVAEPAAASIVDMTCLISSSTRVPTESMRSPKRLSER